MEKFEKENILKGLNYNIWLCKYTLNNNISYTLFAEQIDDYNFETLIKPTKKFEECVFFNEAKRFLMDLIEDKIKIKIMLLDLEDVDCYMGQNCANIMTIKGDILHVKKFILINDDYDTLLKDMLKYLEDLKLNK